MKRCSPIQMRKNLQLVHNLKTTGIDFVPIPVKSDEDRKALEADLLKRLDTLIVDAELGEETRAEA